MEKHNIIIGITIVIGCLVTFQSLRVKTPGEGDSESPWITPIPLWEGSLNEIPDEYGVNLVLRGKLSHAPFPLIVDLKLGKPIDPRLEHWNALTLELFDPGSGNKTGFYYLISENKSFWVPMCGNTEIGGVELYKLDEAKLIEVEGSAFDIVAVNEKRYHMFQVNRTRVLGHLSEEEAIHIGRHFLDGKGYKTGKVLSEKLEEKDPNFYWHILTKIDRPDLQGPRFCWVIRFEQAERPGHFFEVWIDATEYFVVGGSSCK